MTTARTISGSRSPRRPGIVAVETALLLPLFMFLLFIGIEFGRMFWIKTVINDAAAEGARMAILHEPSDTDITQAMSNLLDRQGVESNYQITVGDRTAGQPVAVTVDADLDMLVLPDGLMAMMGTTRISSTVVMTHVN